MRLLFALLGLEAFLLLMPAAFVRASPSADTPRVEASELILSSADGRELRGNQVQGLVLDIPGEERLKINRVMRDASLPGLYLYDFSRRDRNTGTWVPACQPDRRRQRLAVALPGYTDEQDNFVPDRDHIRISCLSGAMAKCLHFGYGHFILEREQQQAHSRPVALYQSCVRMTRADYCGDGHAATHEGVRIAFWDDAPAHARRPLQAEAFEAGWTPAGAVCVRHTRVPGIESLGAVLKRCPRLHAAGSGPRCSEAHARALGAVLFNASGVSRSE